MTQPSKLSAACARSGIGMFGGRTDQTDQLRHSRLFLAQKEKVGVTAGARVDDCRKVA